MPIEPLVNSSKKPDKLTCSNMLSGNISANVPLLNPGAFALFEPPEPSKDCSVNAAPNLTPIKP